MSTLTKRMAKQGYCGRIQTATTKENGGGAMSKTDESTTGREIVREWILDAAGTSDADDGVIEAAIDIVLSVSHVRRCWECGRVALHRDDVKPYVLCSVCNSQDTRKVKER